MRKQSLIFAIFIIAGFCANAQQVEIYRADHDNLPYYFGLSFAYNSSFLHTTKSPKFLQNDSVLSVEPGKSGGISLGLLGTLRLSNRLQFRFNPQLIVGASKYLTYNLKYPTVDEPAVVVKTLPTTIVSFPFQLKFNSDRINNFRVYMFGGVKGDIDLAANSAARNADDQVKLQKYDYGVEGGVGFNFYLPFVTVSPELKFSDGIRNLLVPDAALKYSSVLDKIQSRMIVFSILLEE